MLVHQKVVMNGHHLAAASGGLAGHHAASHHHLQQAHQAVAHTGLNASLSSMSELANQPQSVGGAGSISNDRNSEVEAASNEAISTAEAASPAHSPDGSGRGDSAGNSGNTASGNSSGNSGSNSNNNNNAKNSKKEEEKPSMYPPDWWWAERQVSLNFFRCLLCNFKDVMVFINVFYMKKKIYLLKINFKMTC